MPAVQSLEELKAVFGLKYQLDALESFDASVGLRGKDVLEVGGSLPEDLVRGHYGARTWIAIDDLTAYKSFSQQSGKLSADAIGGDISSAPWTPDRWAVHDGRIQELSPALQGRFDLIVSIATLEHVDNMPGALESMRAALKPGGKLCFLVGPVWSGADGYHIYPSYFPEHREMTARLLKFLRPWSHLALTRPEMYAELRAEFGHAFAQVVVSSIYESTRLNRLFMEEYMLHFQNHGLELLHFNPWGTEADVDRSLLAQAKSRYPAFDQFEWRGFTCVLTPRAGSELGAPSSGTQG